MTRLDLMSQAELRVEKKRLAGRTSKRAQRRLFGVVRELNARFDHTIPPHGFYTTKAMDYA